MGWYSTLAPSGLGNLVLAFGLYRSIERGTRRGSAALLFGLAAAGIVLVGLFPADSGGAVSAAGLVHRTVVIASFPIEALALFLFSAAFVRTPRWRRRARLSFAWSVLAAASVAGLLAAVHEKFEPGLAERFALAVFMAWEAAVSFGLLREPRRAAYAGRGAVKSRAKRGSQAAPMRLRCLARGAAADIGRVETTDRGSGPAFPSWCRMQRGTKNVGTADRVLRVAIGSALVVLGVALLIGGGPLVWWVLELALIALGIDFIVTGVRGHCPLYKFLGWSTAGR